MFIKCPNCSVGYEIPDEIVLSDGRKMKCSNCGHIFVYHNTPQSSGSDFNGVSNFSRTDVDNLDVVLPEQTKDDVKIPVAFLEDEDDNKHDAISESFTPVSDVGHKTAGYHPSIWVVGVCLLIVCVLGGLGFYYTDFLSSDYLLGFNQNSQNKLEQEKYSVAVNRRKRIRQSRPVQSVIKKLEQAKSSTQQVYEPTETEVNLDHPVEPMVQELSPNNLSIPEHIEPVVIEDTTPVVPGVDPIVMYKSNEIVHDDNGDLVVKIKGTIQNPSTHEIVLPPMVHAVAFDASGRELFRKDIYLTTRFLAAGETQDIFGSYTWKLSDPNVTIQWIDMGF